MNGITMDNQHYRVRVRFETLGRSFRIPEGPNAGEMMSGRFELDSRGTYYDYEMQVEPDPRYPGDYDQFFDDISAPGGTHSVVMPYGQGTVTLQAMVQEGGDTYRGRVAGTRRWGGLRVSFTARAPSRTPL